MSAHRTDLLTRRDDLQLHNSTKTTGDLEFSTDPVQWSYSVSVPIGIPTAPEPELEPSIAVELQVLEGSVGVGVLDDSMQHFISSEVDVIASGRPVTVRLTPNPGDTRAHVMVRNAASGGSSSRFMVLGATLQFTACDRRLLVPTECPHIEPNVRGAPPLSGTFDLLISHSSRSWNADQCDRGYLERRYAKPDRLANPPPFESLPPNAAPYYGLLTVFRLQLSPAGVTSRVLQHYVSPEKVMHAAVAGDEVVVCFDAGLAVFARRQDAPFVDVVPESAERVVDPWFGGLHTVVPVDSRTCLVSSSGADAVLWLDLGRRQVVRRWRLPAPRYGTNYDLDGTTWLSEHYIPNDLQLGHLNCASPDGQGGAFFSVLGQGDVGCVDSSGHCEVLVSGYVGCHGVRYDRDASLLYFSDSCTGRLMRVNGRDRAAVLFDACSRWLHDAVHLAGGLFLLTLGDRNRLVLADTNTGRSLAEWNFSACSGSVQFLSVFHARR